MAVSSGLDSPGIASHSPADTAALANISRLGAHVLGAAAEEAPDGRSIRRDALIDPLDALGGEGWLFVVQAGWVDKVDRVIPGIGVAVEALRVRGVVAAVGRVGLVEAPAPTTAR
jgi:hypothetical protein